MDPPARSRNRKYADPKNYREGLALAVADRNRLGIDWILERIWQRAEEQATCDNGGFNAWMCPHGCGYHTVSFDREESE